jgi:hypothetical protein
MPVNIINSKSQPGKVTPINATASVAFAPDQLLSIEEVAHRLKTDVAWVREKCRRRCANPIPVMNAGRHLLFDWLAVSEWLRHLPRPAHAPHRRRIQEQFKANKLKAEPGAREGKKAA